MGLKVYYDLMSQPCRALLIFLKANNIPFESKLIALRKGEHMTPEFSKLNPLTKVPVIEDNGFVLTESIAMVRYLAREYPIQDHWYPKDSKQQARVDEYLEWQHLNTRLYGSMIFRTRVIDPLLQQKPFDSDKLERCKKDFQKNMKDFEKRFLAENAFLAGPKISVADLFAACEIEQPLAVGSDVASNLPKKVEAWLQNVQHESEPHYSEAHEIIRKLAKAIEMGKA